MAGRRKPKSGRGGDLSQVSSARCFYPEMLTALYHFCFSHWVVRKTRHEWFRPKACKSKCFGSPLTELKRDSREWNLLSFGRKMSHSCVLGMLILDLIVSFHVMLMSSHLRTVGYLLDLYSTVEGRNKWTHYGLPQPGRARVAFTVIRSGHAWSGRLCRFSAVSGGTASSPGGPGWLILKGTPALAVRGQN